MKVVYVAAPYRARTYLDIRKNIQFAESISLKYWKKGYTVICPHKNTAFFDGQADDRIWLKGDIELLKRCDVVVFAGEWEYSQGCRDEHKAAKRFDKEIIYEKELKEDI